MQGTHMGGPWYIPDVDLEWGESGWLAKGNLEEMPHKSDSHLIRLFHFFKSDSNHQEDLILSEPDCLSTCTVIF